MFCTTLFPIYMQNYGGPAGAISKKHLSFQFGFFPSAFTVEKWVFPVSLRRNKSSSTSFSFLFSPLLLDVPISSVYFFLLIVSNALPSWVKLCTLSGCQKFKGGQVVIQSESWGALMCFVYLTGAVAFRSYLHLILKSRTHRKYLSMGEDAGKAKINHAWWQCSEQSKKEHHNKVKLWYTALKVNNNYL